MTFRAASGSTPSKGFTFIPLQRGLKRKGAKLRALDLYCGAGGASKGLADAGYEMTGVDHVEQPRYPYEFILGDALSQNPKWIASFDLIWASPPCQKFSAYRRKNPETIGETALNLSPRTRSLLRASGLPWIIENVPGSPLKKPCVLCGSMFGLEVRRHRWFETSTPIPQPACRHDLQQGDFPQATNRVNRRKTVEIGVWRIPLETQQKAIGIGWMELAELSQAVPPAYATHLARELILAERSS
jgi:DNA (cytosine-5)-methyltransferase 1